MATIPKLCKWCNSHPAKKTFCSHPCRNAWISYNNKTNNPLWDESIRDKMAKSLTGKVQPRHVVEKRKISQAKAHEIDPNLRWRQTEHLRRLAAEKPFGWERMRKLALDRDRHICQNCFARNKRVVVHHKDHQGKNLPSVTMMNNDLSNLITLCYSCHLSIHTWAVRRGEGPKLI